MRVLSSISTREMRPFSSHFPPLTTGHPLGLCFLYEWLMAP